MKSYTTLIDAKDLIDNLGKDKLILLDCRRKRGVQHIQGAQLVNYAKDLKGKIIKGVTGRSPLPKVDVFIKKCSQWGIDATKQVVVYDENNGAYAARLWWMLKWLGHEQVAVLNGGWGNWVDLVLPMSSGIIKPQKTNFEAQEHRDMLVYKHEVAQIVDQREALLVDARAPERYRGEVEPVDHRAGHIPSSINLPHSENCDEKGLWKNKVELRKRIIPITTKGQSTVMYCGSGITACHNILAAEHSGLRRPKLYVGSWSEWIAEEI